MDITFRAVIEVLGRPKEHIEEALQGYLKKLSEDKNYVVNKKEILPAKEQEDGLWTIFTEVEIETNTVHHLMNFCFEYMPSLIEITQPSSLQISDADLSSFFAELQSRLHHVDMIAKHTRVENETLKKNMSALLRNYITVLLQKKPLSAKQLSNLTGVSQEKLEDFLDQLIDQGKVDLEGEQYVLKEEEHTAQDA